MSPSTQATKPCQHRERLFDGRPVHYERHRPEQSTLYRLVQGYLTAFLEHTEASTGSSVPRFIQDEFGKYLACGILAHGFLRLRCGECGHDRLLAFSCKRRGICPSCGARRMSQTAAYLVDHVIPFVPVRQWVLSLPIPLRLLLAAQPQWLTPVLQVVQRELMRNAALRTGISVRQGQGGAVTLIQRFGSAAKTAGRAGAASGAASDPISRSACPQCQTARAGRAVSTARAERCGPGQRAGSQRWR